MIVTCKICLKPIREVDLSGQGIDAGEGYWGEICTECKTVETNRPPTMSKMGGDKAKRGKA
jgi:hypothetical protein